jgi:hypothetical protein
MIIALNERASLEHYKRHEDDLVKAYRVPDTLEDIYSGYSFAEPGSERRLDEV